MLVSWNWLSQYVELPMQPLELTERLAMAGLNHEQTRTAERDVVIDLEVTSNRADCLSHIGVAREVATLWNRPLKIPDISLPPGTGRAEDDVVIRVQSPELCSRYIGRVIRGVRIGPSPPWLADRLRAIDVAVINNVVDATNYVMFECGQPLHAFDLARLHGPEIIVRRAAPKEPFVAIDHHQYTLDDSMCVIADARHAVALAGVMGGVDSEVTETSTDLLLESANFDAVAIRHASRSLRLRSPSSYRFERKVDPMGVDWASRRACQLILELAGGTLVEGRVEDGPQSGVDDWAGTPIILRLSQIERILGIDVDRNHVISILQSLGLHLEHDSPAEPEFVPPSWRPDLTREIDLIEEVARIHGYHQIPEDVHVPMRASQKTRLDRVLQRVRHGLTAAGFDEAITPSVVDQRLAQLGSPWTEASPMVSQPSLLRGADQLRRSLIPSLLDARQANQASANSRVELFEVAKIYLPQPKRLPQEPWMLGLTSGDSYLRIKGVVETLLVHLGSEEKLEAQRVDDVPLLDPRRTARLTLGGKVLGIIGEVHAEALRSLGIRGGATVAEIWVDTLERSARLIRQARPISDLPAVEYDLNFVVDQNLAWADLERSVYQAGGALLEAVDYRETYRNPERDGAGTKRLLLSLRLRAADRTLTGSESDEVRQQVIRLCQRNHGARLLG